MPRIENNDFACILDTVCIVGLLKKQMIQLANKFYGKLHTMNLNESKPKSLSQGKSAKLP